MNILRIALNDMRVVLKDRMVIFWWLAMPIAFVFMFSFMFRDRMQDSTWLPVFKFDNHEIADIFLGELRTDKYWIDVKTTKDEHWIDDWSRALIIPATFSKSILSGERVDLTVTKGQGSPEKYLAAQTLLVRTLIKFNAAIASIDLIERGWSDESKKDLIAELNKPPQLSVDTKQHFSLRPPPSGFAFTLPAYMVMFMMMMTVMYGGITLIEERTNKRISRLVATPVSVFEIFIGKMLGFTADTIVAGTGGTATSTININVNPLECVFVRSDNLSFASSYESIVSKSNISDIIAMIPITVSSGNYIVYNDSSAFESRLNDDRIDNISLYLTSAVDDDHLLSLNLDWTIQLQVNEYKIENTSLERIDLNPIQEATKQQQDPLAQEKDFLRQKQADLQRQLEELELKRKLKKKE